jgi:hypothetical protein
MEGLFEIGAKVKFVDGKTDVVQTKALEGYNIYRLPTSDIHNPTSWTKLNTEPIVSSEAIVSYTDNTWAPAEEGFYSYAVEAIYTEEVSAPSFSSTVANGIYSQVTINVTTNSGESAEGASIKLVNNNGHTAYSYNAIVNESGSVSFGAVSKGTYTLTATKFGFIDFSDASVEISSASETLGVELEEYTIIPGQLAVNVDNENQTATLTWEHGTTTEYILDDGTFENGLALNPGADAYLGNYFDVTETGSIVEFVLHGQANEGSAGNEVTIEVFNASGSSLGVTEAFEIPADDWASVPVQDIQFSGAFYAMVHWDNLPGNTNYLSIDTDGPNTNAGYYYDVSNGFLPIAELGTAPGAFLLRVVANVGDKEVAMSSQMLGQANNVAIQLQESNIQGVAQSAKAAKSFIGYNVYLNNLETPVAGSIAEKEYVFTATDLPQNDTYVAAVSSVYTSGESELATIEFSTLFVSVDEVLSKAITVYPNPARNEIYIQNADNAQVMIYNLSGSRMLNIKQHGNNRIDVSMLDAGMYIIKIINDQKVYSTKITIMR